MRVANNSQAAGLGFGGMAGCGVCGSSSPDGKRLLRFRAVGAHRSIISSYFRERLPLAVPLLPAGSAAPVFGLQHTGRFDHCLSLDAVPGVVSMTAKLIICDFFIVLSLVMALFTIGTMITLLQKENYWGTLGCVLYLLVCMGCFFSSVSLVFK